MKLPSTTSKLLALQKATNAALHRRLAEIFRRYRALAFVGRDDHLFQEHWTPELAASGYDFESFEAKQGEMFLHGIENAGGFIYRISISFPLDLIDSPSGIEAYFQRQQEAARRAAPRSTATTADNVNPPAH